MLPCSTHAGILSKVQGNELSKIKQSDMDMKFVFSVVLLCAVFLCCYVAGLLSCCVAVLLKCWLSVLGLGLRAV